MFIDWLCVYDDGTRPLAPGIAPDQRRSLSLRVNEDVTIRVKLIDTVGAPFALPSGGYLALTGKGPAPDGRQVISKRSTPDAVTESVHIIAIAAADTKSVRIARGTYDLIAVSGGGVNRVVLIPLSELLFGPTNLGVLPS